VIADSLAWLEHERHSSASQLTHLALVLKKWIMGVQREKATYHTMNLFSRNPERGTLEAQGWVLKTGVEQAKDAIRSVHLAAAAGGRVSPFFFEVLTGDGLPTPPTFFPTNKFTKAFQGFVDTYGVPRYQEANPALWAIVTFPFLFGVMYGDIGHATILTIAAAWMVWNEKALALVKNEMFTMVYYGRYMILLMGLFAIYCGAIYNDVFSLGATPWPSNWYYVGASKEATWSGKDKDVYPFGIDPEWHLSENDLLFFNSLKMKLSVVLGITQMTFGLVLKTSNAIYFGNSIDLFCECIPQLVFMIALFGYMIFLIVLKWSIDWRDPASRPGAPPSLIDTMINIALKPGGLSDPLYEGQIGVQTVILLSVFVCVPVMLFVKPYLVHKQNQAKAAARAGKLHDDEKKGLLKGGASGGASGGAYDLETLDTGAAAGAGAGAGGRVGSRLVERKAWA
jgi:V-type H+-transporting ATPase subunit a